MWTQHGGSGLGISWRDAWSLEWDELLELQEEIGHRRSAEASAIKAARSRKS